MPSLYIDLESGRTKNEIGWLNGAVVRKGNEVHVPTPVNRMLTDVLLRLVEAPSERELWRHNPARLLASAAEYRAAESVRRYVRPGPTHAIKINATAANTPNSINTRRVRRPCNPCCAKPINR